MRVKEVQRSTSSDTTAFQGLSICLTVCIKISSKYRTGRIFGEAADDVQLAGGRAQSG